MRVGDVFEERVEGEDEHLATGQLAVGPGGQVRNQNLEFCSQRSGNADGRFVRSIFVQS